MKITFSILLFLVSQAVFATNPVASPTSTGTPPIGIAPTPITTPPIGIAPTPITTPPIGIAPTPLSAYTTYESVVADINLSTGKAIRLTNIGNSNNTLVVRINGNKHIHNHEFEIIVKEKFVQ